MSLCEVMTLVFSHAFEDHMVIQLTNQHELQELCDCLSYIMVTPVTRERCYKIGKWFYSSFILGCKFTIVVYTVNGDEIAKSEA